MHFLKIFEILVNFDYIDYKFRIKPAKKTIVAAMFRDDVFFKKFAVFTDGVCPIPGGQWRRVSDLIEIEYEDE